VLAPNLAGYRVYYGTATRAYGQGIDAGNVTTCSMTGLRRNTTYYFSVTALDTSGGESGFSNEVSKAMP